MNNTYSFVFLTNDKDQLGRLKELVSSLSGSVTDEKSMGNKQLAYPINKIETADFYELSLSLPSDKMTEFKKKLTFEENIIRYLLLSKEE